MGRVDSMSKIVTILVLTLANTLATYGQQRSDVRQADANPQNRIVIIDPGISLGRPTFLLPPSLEADSMFRLPSFLFIPENFTIPQPFLQGVFEERVDLLSPLRLQMEKESRLRPLQTVLGTVEIGAVGYLAYRHIRKYGFLR